MRMLGKLLKAMCVFAVTAAMAPIIAVCLPFRCALDVLAEE